MYRAVTSLRKNTRLLFLVIVFATETCVGQLATFSEATPYLAMGQDPLDFFDPLLVVTIEDFEDNSVDPFLAETTGFILPPNFKLRPQFDGLGRFR